MSGSLKCLLVLLNFILGLIYWFLFLVHHSWWCSTECSTVTLNYCPICWKPWEDYQFWYCFCPSRWGYPKHALWQCSFISSWAPSTPPDVTPSQWSKCWPSLSHVDNCQNRSKVNQIHWDQMEIVGNRFGLGERSRRVSSKTTLQGRGSLREVIWGRL